MGTYTELTIAGYPIISSKSAVIPELMTVFRESDRQMFTRKLSERNALVWGKPEESEGDEVETAIEYACETTKVIDRLNVMGFTLRRAQDEFDTFRRAKLGQYEEWAEDGGDTQWLADSTSMLEYLGFEVYTEAFAKIIEDSLRPLPFDDYMKDGLDVVAKYILGHDHDYPFGFFCSDIRSLLRLACEVVAKNSHVVQDITALVDGGHYGKDEPVCTNATSALTAGHPENSPRILLTEGSTDAAILKKSLAILYPHLCEYYAFLDFASSRSPGGAGHLASLVKAFAGAGITNRIIALFDNDTAGQEARRALGTISLPKNVVVMAYPELELLRSYPTQGPGGLTSQDVNGLAGSIELYLGEEVLRNAQGALTAVQWKGYNEALKQYQGEVIGKANLHARFFRMAEQYIAEPEALKTADWSGLSAILQKIFHAFD